MRRLSCIGLLLVCACQSGNGTTRSVADASTGGASANGERSTQPSSTSSNERDDGPTLINFASFSDARFAAPLTLGYAELADGGVDARIGFTARRAGGDLINLQAPYKPGAQSAVAKVGDASVNLQLGAKFWYATEGTIKAAVDGTGKATLTLEGLTFAAGADVMGPISGRIEGPLVKSCYPQSAQVSDASGSPTTANGMTGTPARAPVADPTWSSAFCEALAD